MREGQVQLRQDLSQLLDIGVAMARLEKRPIETENLVETCEPERVPSPPPLPVAQFPHIPTTPPAVGLYEMPAPGMPKGVLVSRQFGSK